MNNQSAELNILINTINQLNLPKVSLREIAPAVPQSTLDNFLDIIKDFNDKKSEYAIIDVRAEKEFTESPIPFSINVPILSDNERHNVGLLYGQHSKELAVNYAYYLAQKKEALFLKTIREYAGNKKVIIFCWRGGGRSRYSTNLLRQNGIDAIQLAGGQKAFRGIIHQYLYENKYHIISLSGKTGCGKSQILEYLQQNNPDFPILHLEEAAGHASSVFGEIRFKLKNISMPNNQQTFENNLLLQIIKYKNNFPTFLSEKESKRIGKFSIPPSIFNALEEENHIAIESPLELRLNRLEEEYFKTATATAQVRQQIDYIAKRLGPLRTKQLRELIDCGNYQEFLREMMVNYYDLNYKKTNKEPIATINNTDLKKTAELITKLIYQK